MGRRFYIRLSIVILLEGLFFSHFICAQSSACLEQQSHASVANKIKITIVNLEIHGDNPLSETDRAQLLAEIQKLPLSADRESDDDWNGEVGEFIRFGLQDRGYFRSLVTTTPYLVRAGAGEQVYIVAADVESGPQYRMGEIKFSGATAFSAGELRKQFAIQQEEVFDVSKIREGMESMTRLYDSKGFIDQVPEPEISIDDKSSRIDILMKVDEGKPYFVGTVSIQGLDSKVEQLLQSQLVPGQVFDNYALRRFFTEHKAELPENLSFDDVVKINKDVRSSTVIITIDSRFCPTTARTSMRLSPD
jgi:outer membrane protein assembly factor BamA